MTQRPVPKSPAEAGNRGFKNIRVGQGREAPDHPNGATEELRLGLIPVATESRYPGE